MTSKRSFIKRIQIWGTILLLLIAGTIIAIDINNFRQFFNSQTKQIRSDYIARQKQMVRYEVNRVVDLIEHHKKHREELAKNNLKSEVYQAYVIAQNIYRQYRRSHSDSEIKQMIMSTLRPGRLGEKKNHYFISDTEGTMILNPLRVESEGVNQLNIQNSTGQYIAREMIAIIEQSGEGFYEYYSTDRYTSGRNLKKISYIKRLEPFNWFIGADFYAEDITTEIKDTMLSEISKVRFGKEGYIFVNRLNGDALISNGIRMPGDKKLWQISAANMEKMKAVFEKEYKAALVPGGDFINYSWVKLTDPTQEFQKTSFIYGIPELQWLIGAGVYLDEVEIEIGNMYGELKSQIKTRTFYFSLVSLAIILCFLFLFNRLNRRLKGDFNLFISFLNKSAQSDEPIDRDLVHFSELDQMAKNANQMLRDKINAQQDLLDERNALRDSELKFREMADLLPQVIYEADLQGNITFANQQAFGTFGYSTEDISRGVNLFKMVQPDERARAKENIKLILSGHKVKNSEYTILKKDESLLSMMMYTNAIKKDGKITGFRGIAVDITERKKIEEELLKGRQLESVGILAGGIAHDFNNILAAILGNISLALITTDPDDETYELLVEAEKASLRAKDLTHQLLTFAKGGEPVKQIAAIDTVIRDSANFVLRGSNVRCDFTFSEGLWPVAIDSGQISQVIQNIIINASQAMPNGGIVAIDCSNFCPGENDKIPVTPGNYIKITIRDQGIGIPSGILTKIFDPYFTTKQTGSGLGLATTHSIISKHDGYISADSAPDQGAVFTIYLLASDSRQELETKETIPQPVVTHAKIMIMDDEEMVRSVVKRALSQRGYEVMLAKDGDTAILLYQEALKAGEPIDLVIMDLTIPGGMGGKECVRKIHKIEPGAKVIVCSGYSNDPVMADFKAHGFLAAINKPFQIGELTQVVAGVLSR